MTPAEAPDPALQALLQALVCTPSRPGEDDLGPVQETMAGWLEARGARLRRLRGPAGQPLGLYTECQGRPGGPWVVLDATLDTAGFGDPARWRHPPTSGQVEGGWLHGRGSADSKAGAALFAHLLVQWLARDAQAWRGRLGVLFDLDEHSGGFGGAKAFFEPPHGEAPRPDVVVIGYPGDDAIVTGSRGFLRARLQVAGVAAHSGAAVERGVNAIDRAAALARALATLPLDGTDPALGLPPQLTVTGIDGGGPGFSQVPDHCELRLDIRLTTRFADADARAAVAAAVAESDRASPGAPATRVDWIAGWPAYRVGDEHPMVRALHAATAQVYGQPRPTRVVGPSNIGNYLAGLGVPALCGFGPLGEGIHATDERVWLPSLEPVRRVYDTALQRLFVA